MKKIAIIVVTVLVVLGGAIWLYSSLSEDTKQSTNNPAVIPDKSDVPIQEPSFDKKQYSIDDPASIWVVVNKQRPLNPKNYVPLDLVFPDVRLRVPGNESMQLRAETAKALKDMFTAASSDGIELMLSSGYRSYNYQVTLYGGYVKSQGQAAADTQSARPGYSEHQTGFAADIRPINGQCELEECFGEMPEGKWIAANGHTYGFIIRYPLGAKDVVGYEYEPWHVRYIGKEAAAEYVKSNTTTLEEFFGLPPAPDYAS